MLHAIVFPLLHQSNHMYQSPQFSVSQLSRLSHTPSHTLQLYSLRSNVCIERQLVACRYFRIEDAGERYLYVHTFIHLPAHLISLPADVHNVSRRIFSSPSPTIPPCSSPPPPPVPLWPTAAHRIVPMPTILHGWACMYASLAVWRHVCMQKEEEVAAFFLSFEQLNIARSTAVLLPDLSSDGSVCR